MLVEVVMCWPPDPSPVPHPVPPIPDPPDPGNNYYVKLDSDSE